MACHTFGTAIICCPNIYKYPYNEKEFYFEWHNYLGPVAVKKRDLEPRKSIPTGFYKAVTEFDKLSKEDRKKYFIAY